MLHLPFLTCVAYGMKPRWEADIGVLVVSSSLGESCGTSSWLPRECVSHLELSDFPAWLRGAVAGVWNV